MYLPKNIVIGLMLTDVQKNSPFHVTQGRIDTFFEYFKNLYFCEEEYSDINIDEVCNDPMHNEMLNGIITEKEVLDAIKGLKNNKAPGSDKLINEF